ncbi:hypothetical protein B0I35DRAFT_443457 [Stachybotrys elegans]|uniref:Aflatoxin regulatory protein domain-containing protein n=1 Tax=Stachybotrys elegans TaxID=80388 RepID=A0A8K0WLR6_9HYPO|nr:hypothetical protein B0I35DRAFT_443457 [Stachybotrys elegans]
MSMSEKSAQSSMQKAAAVMQASPYRTPEMHHESEDGRTAASTGTVSAAAVAAAVAVGAGGGGGAGDDAACCSCLRVLTDQLCSLNAVERKQDHLRLDTTFSNTSAVLDSSGGALTCGMCHLDTKVLLLVMTLLQTVINWARVGSQKALHPSDAPPVTFGEWRVSAEDGNVIRALLVNRVLAKSTSTVEVLRQRIHEVSINANKSNLAFQMMDAEALRSQLGRLEHSMREVTQIIKAQGLDA